MPKRMDDVDKISPTISAMADEMHTKSNKGRVANAGTMPTKLDLLDGLAATTTTTHNFV